MNVYKFTINKKDSGDKYSSIRWFEDGSNPQDHRHKVHNLEEFIEHYGNNFSNFLN